MLKRKNLLAALLALVMLLSLAACGGKDSGAPSGGESQPQSLIHKYEPPRPY